MLNIGAMDRLYVEVLHPFIDIFPSFPPLWNFVTQITNYKIVTHNTVSNFYSKRHGSYSENGIEEDKIIQQKMYKIIKHFK